MKLQQLRYLREVAKCELNLSRAAKSLHTSQPGISKQIRQLESELGVELLVRNGKRIVDVTQPGRAILDIATRILRDAENLTQVVREFTADGTGSLTIATGHNQARYGLASTITTFSKRQPKVRLSMRQGSPQHVAELVRSGAADLAIATRAAECYDGLVLLPCHRWNRVVITPRRHPLLRERPLTLEAVARYPIVTFDFAFAQDSPVKRAFVDRRITPKIALTAMDVDVIKAHVEMGLGVGIIAKLAFVPERDLGLRMIDAGHLFESSTTHIVLRPDTCLRSYAYDFIELFAPHLKRTVVDATIKSEGSSYEL